MSCILRSSQTGSRRSLIMILTRPLLDRRSRSGKMKSRMFPRRSPIFPRNPLVRRALRGVVQNFVGPPTKKCMTPYKIMYHILRRIVPMSCKIPEDILRRMGGQIQRILQRILQRLPGRLKQKIQQRSRAENTVLSSPVRKRLWITPGTGNGVPGSMIQSRHGLLQRSRGRRTDGRTGSFTSGF